MGKSKQKESSDLRSQRTELNRAEVRAKHEGVIDPRLDRMYVKNVRCPYCKGLIPKFVDTCSGCGITKAQIANASNLEAKKIIKEKLPGTVLLVRQRPEDVQFGKFMFYMIFLGWMGAHNFFIGRRVRGWIVVAGCIIGILGYLVFPAAPEFGEVTGLRAVRRAFDVGGWPFPTDLVMAVVLFMWFFDWFAVVLFGLFKYPVRIDPKSKKDSGLGSSDDNAGDGLKLGK